MGASEKTKYFVHHKVIALVNRSKEQNTVKGLSNDASITAIPADKGRAPEKLDYLQKATTLFIDKEPYKWLSSNPLTRTINQIKSYFITCVFRKELNPTYLQKLWYVLRDYRRHTRQASYSVTLVLYVTRIKSTVPDSTTVNLAAKFLQNIRK